MNLEFGAQENRAEKQDKAESEEDRENFQGLGDIHFGFLRSRNGSLSGHTIQQAYLPSIPVYKIIQIIFRLPAGLKTVCCSDFPSRHHPSRCRSRAARGNFPALSAYRATRSRRPCACSRIADRER